MNETTMATQNFRACYVVEPQGSLDVTNRTNDLPIDSINVGSYGRRRIRLVLAHMLYLCGCLISGFCGSTACLATDGDRTISFNRDIRPILSDKCFHCHGPSEESREADLRFDVKEDAFNVIEPGNSQESELIHRILDEDPDYRMPPLEINKPLSSEEIELLKKWIDQGAPWSEFWAYEAPTLHPLPNLTSNPPPENWIDHFTLARLEENSLRMSEPADKTTLLRRLYFDLIGLPPSPTQVEAFLKDDSPRSVEKVVDQLLASKHFGERLAIYWLDLVRYADTVGYHGDQPHNISPYRDWVINAFNDNMPFDQFTREQLAGDLFPDPSESQQIASGYNRLLQTTHEGGLQPKEYSAIYAADRVRNVSTVWMGATVGCAQCHDHKYDPYTIKDFYSLAAFFADVDDEKHFKVGTNATPTKRPPEILVISETDRAELELAKSRVETESAELVQFKKSAAELRATLKSLESDQDSNTEQKNSRDSNRQVQMADLTEELKQVNLRIADQEKQLAQSKRQQSEIESRGAWTMITQTLSEPRISRVLPRGNWMDESGEIVGPAIPEFLGKLDSVSERPTRLDLANWLTHTETDNGKRTARVFANRFWYLLMGVGISKSLDDFGGQGEPPAYPELLDNLAMEFVESDWNIKQLIRRIVTSKTYQQSSIGTPRALQIDPYNQLFSHQSRYRFPAELIRDNALAISGLLNLDKIGGKSVKPAQPVNYYQHLNFPPRKYKQDNDEKQWRRGVYVHWQRMFLHPSLKAFDAPSREECTAQRPKSNTPSAALALLNDPIFVEAARMFATRVILETKTDSFEAELGTAFWLALSRPPHFAEAKILTTLYHDSLLEFEQDKDSAAKLLSIGQAVRDQEIDDTRLAAWTTIARAILNLNETMTRN